MDYISKNIDDMTIQELTELCQNPEKYNLKWGEYMKIMAGVEKAMKLANPKQVENEKLEAEIRLLKGRIMELENRLNRLRSIFEEE